MSSEINQQESKVAQLIEEYDLDGIGAELEVAWTSDDVDHKSLRDLADEFNRRLLEQELRDAGLQTFETEVETLYRNLTDDDVSAGIRTELRNRLADDGVDVDDLESAFVSYQAIRSYLKDYRNAHYEEPHDAEKLERDQTTIEELLSRTRSVAERRLKQSRDTDQFDLEEFNTVISLEVVCQRCGTLHDLQELLDAGGCECLQDEGSSDRRD